MTHYPYPQTPSIVPGPLATLFKNYEIIGVVADHILDLYLLAHAKKHVPHDLGNPYQYMRTVAELPADIRYTDLEETFNHNYPLLRSTLALDFLSAFEAHYRHKADDSGLNNGMIYERFIARVKVSDRVIMIDPPLSFISKFISGQQPSARIQFFYTNDRYAEVLQKDPRLLKFTSSHFHKIKHLYADKVLIFGTSLSYDSCKTLFSTLHDQINGNKDVELFSLLPTAFMDHRGKESLRNSIGKLFSIQLIALIPAQAANISPRKRCMLVMRPGVGQIPEVILQNTKCEGGKPVTGLTPTKPRKIAHDYLMQSSATLYSLYQQAKSLAAPAPKRQKPIIYRFSSELSIGYSVSQVGEKFRPKFTPYAPPTARQLRENHEGHGSALCKAFSGKLYPSQDDLIGDIEHFYFSSPKIRDGIKSLSPLFVNHSCSLKTFWFLHQEHLLNDIRYDSQLTEALFLVPYSWDSKLCSLDVCTATKDEIIPILDNVAQAASMSDTRKCNFVKQLEVIFDLVIKDYPNIPSNPITPIIHDLQERPNTLHDTRDNMVRRSWTHAEEMRLLDFLKSDTTSPALALAALIRFYTGISVREACALVWGDYQRIPGFGIYTLTIRRTFISNNTTPAPLDTEYLYRKIPLCQPLNAALSKCKAAIVTEDDIDTLPIISDGNHLDTPLRPKKLIAYERTLWERLDLPELHLHVPNEEDPIDVDINDYQGDWTRSNFRFHVQHNGHMDTDDLRYCLGVRPITTAAQHYNSNLKETSQSRMYCAFNRWATMHNLPETANTDAHTLRLREAPRTSSSSPSQQPTDLILDIHTGKSDKCALELSIFTRYGMSIAMEEITSEEE